MPYKQEDLEPIGNESYLPVDIAAKHLKMSDRQLRRKVAGRCIQYMRHEGKLYFHPDWCEDYLQSQIVKPRKSMR